MNIGDSLTMHFSNDPTVKLSQLLLAAHKAVKETNRRLEAVQAEHRFFLSENDEMKVKNQFNVYNEEGRDSGNALAGKYFLHAQVCDSSLFLVRSDNFYQPETTTSEEELMEAVSSTLMSQLSASDRIKLAQYVEPAPTGKPAP